MTPFLHFHNFAQVVTTAFSMRRETLRNALKDRVSAEQWEALAIDPQRRPETLALAEFAALANCVHQGAVAP